jgi:serine/threonine-protein kinase
LRRGHLPPTTAIRIAGALAWALSHVHDRGAIHCDVKPANILVRNDGQVKLADFGIATPTGRHHDGTVFGSIHYMSPERLVGNAPSPACDVYALGVTLYETITGRRPFTGDSALEVALSHQRANVTGPHRSGPMATSAFSRIPASVDTVIRTALAQDPAHRYPSAAAFALELRSAGRSGNHQILAG